MLALGPTQCLIISNEQSAQQIATDYEHSVKIGCSAVSKCVVVYFGHASWCKHVLTLWAVCEHAMRCYFKVSFCMTMQCRVDTFQYYERSVNTECMVVYTCMDFNNANGISYIQHAYQLCVPKLLTRNEQIYNWNDEFVLLQWYIFVFRGMRFLKDETFRFTSAMVRFCSNLFVLEVF